MTHEEHAPTPGRKRGRPAHQRDEATARRISMLIACGVRVADAADIEGMSEPTLRKLYGDEVRLGHIKAGALIAQSLFRAATRAHHPDTRAAIFWLRSRCGWTEATATAPPPAPGKKQLQQALGMVAEEGSDWGELLNPGAMQ